jgi:pimeloyl-ACP methyl ester carboxylesterase
MMIRIPPRARALVAVTATVLMAALAVPAAVAATATTTAAAAQVPVLDWTSCFGGFQCATARVPLNYQDPDGTKISIAAIRHPATDPAKSLGTLFINGGGPLEQIDGFPADYQAVPAIIRQRFDIMTFDPRGFGFSTAVRCFPTETAEREFLSALPPFPVGAAQIAVWDRTWASFDARCAAANRSLLDHDTTADWARDMNLLREAVGDPVLNYYGASYGTLLGATYANLFPGHVGRMILDGNVNPVALTTPDGNLTTYLRLDTDEGLATNMAAFLRLCGEATTAGCAFSAGTPAATTAKWNTLLSRLDKHPVTTGSPPQTYTYAETIATLATALDTVSDWQQAAVQLQQLWTAPAKTTPVPAKTTPVPAATPADTGASTTVYIGREQQYAVLCSDSPNPHSPGAYAAAAKVAYARSGGWGLDEAWYTEPCAQWPGNGAQDRYTGPWDRWTANPILLLGNTGDTALPYQQDELAMEHDLARARLLTVQGYGHTEQTNPSTCAENYQVSYVLTGALPPAGTICQENATPFAAG